MQDIQSNRSSSRSPILFNSHATPGRPEPAKIVESASSISDASNDEDESADEDESSDGEERDDGDKTVLAPVQRSSPPDLSTTKPNVNMSSERKQSQRKNLTISRGSSTGDESVNTQDEVDFQLTSSMFEASSTAIEDTSIRIPSSSNATKPKFSIGASLSSLNAKKPILGASASNANKAQPLKLAENNDEESEEESEYESNSESSSDSDNKPEPTQSFPKLRQSQQLESDDSDSDSDSDSESGNDEENEDDEQIARNELAAQIAKMASDAQGSTQSYDVASPNLIKGLQSSRSGSVKGKTGSSNKFLVGYTFSQPK
jgi:hypothetical protein